MTIKLAINGFGRIGRLSLRQALQHDDLEVVAINDLNPPDMLLHLFKYDTMQGRFTGEAKVVDGNLVVNGNTLKLLAISDAKNYPWGELGIDIVLDCTGAFTSKEKASAHLAAGAKKVIISAPAGNDVKTVVFNVNHDILRADDTIISAASCTTNCLAPMAKVLHERFGIVRGLMTTIHAYTGDQNTLDSSHRKNDKRRARAAAMNIVPNSTGAAKAIGLVIPELNGKLDGSAQRVPVATGSLTELVCLLEKEVSIADVNAAMKAAVNESFGYTEEELVSTDIIGMSEGSLFDATQTRVFGSGETQLVKTVAWYDNEMSYTNQYIRTARYFGSLV